MFISPVLKDSIEVGGCLVHELVHAAVGIECKHRGAFARVAKTIGLEGKMTATTPGEALRTRLKELIAKIGEYPHARLIASNRPKTQTTRMLKVTCKECGCVVRMTANGLRRRARRRAPVAVIWWKTRGKNWRSVVELLDEVINQRMILPLRRVCAGLMRSSSQAQLGADLQSTTAGHQTCTSGRRPGFRGVSSN